MDDTNRGLVGAGFPRDGNLRQVSTRDWAGAGLAYLETRPAAKLTEAERSQPIVISWEGSFARRMKFPPYNPDLLLTREGYAKVDEMKQQAAYWSPLSVLLYSILHKNWRIVPATLDQSDPDYELASKIAKQVTWHLENIEGPSGMVQDFRSVIYEQLNAVHIGFSLQEIIWRYVDVGQGPSDVVGQWGFSRFSPKRARQIGFDVDPHDLSVMAITNRSYYGGGLQFNIPPEKVLFYTFNPENGGPYGRGVWRPCYKHWWSLEVLEKLQVLALEIHGSPRFKVIGPTADETALAAIHAAVEAFARGASGVFPEGFEIELLTLESGALGAFDAAKRWHSDQITRAILLQTLTTSQGEKGAGGSYALGGVQQNTQDYVQSFVRNDMQDLFRKQLFRRWVLYNYGPEYTHLTPKLDLGEWNASDKMMVSQALSVLLTNKAIHPSETWIRDYMQVPPIEEDAKQLLDEERDMARKQAEKALEKPAGVDNRSKSTAV